MNLINSDELIPLSKELEHTKAYLSLEKLRFGDALKVEYAIEADDGCGFDSEQAPDIDRKHIGIENVRFRLKNMCGGTLTIDSEKGEGTVAVITLFKE